MIILKEYNLKHHYVTKHGEPYEKNKGNERKKVTSSYKDDYYPSKNFYTMLARTLMLQLKQVMWINWQSGKGSFWRIACWQLLISFVLKKRACSTVWINASSSNSYEQLQGKGSLQTLWHLMGFLSGGVLITWALKVAIQWDNGATSCSLPTAHLSRILLEIIHDHSFNISFYLVKFSCVKHKKQENNWSELAYKVSWSSQ